MFKKISLMDKFNFYEYLSIMLDGGVTITQSLESVSERVKNVYFSTKIKELLIYISSGDNLYKAMKKMPDVFNQSEASIIEAGEKSGTLVESLASMGEEFKKLHELRTTIKTALTYPTIIMIFLVLAVVIVMTYVVPSIIPLIEEAGAEKPFATTALIATSDFIINKYIFIILFIALLVIIFKIYQSSPQGKRQIDHVLLSFPLIGNVYKNYLIASSSSILGNLMHAGVPIIKSLQLVGKSSNNIIYEDLFNSISMKVSSGKKLVDSIIETDQEHHFFPSDFLQLLTVGEKTASIYVVCKKINEQYTRQVQYSLTNLSRWIEPIAILLAGFFVLWFAFAIFGAILNLTQSVG